MIHNLIKPKKDSEVDNVILKYTSLEGDKPSTKPSASLLSKIKPVTQPAEER